MPMAARLPALRLLLLLGTWGEYGGGSRGVGATAALPGRSRRGGRSGVPGVARETPKSHGETHRLCHTGCVLGGGFSPHTLGHGVSGVPVSAHPWHRLWGGPMFPPWASPKHGGSGQAGGRWPVTSDEAAEPSPKGGRRERRHTSAGATRVRSPQPWGSLGCSAHPGNEPTGAGGATSHPPHPCCPPVPAVPIHPSIHTAQRAGAAPLRLTAVTVAPSPVAWPYLPTRSHVS